MTFKSCSCQTFCSHIYKQFPLGLRRQAGKLTSFMKLFKLHSADSKAKNSKVPALGFLVPRWVTTSCAVFWFAIITLLLSSFSSIKPTGIALLATLAVGSSVIVVYLSAVCVQKLQNELKTLAKLARRDQVDAIADFEYAEFTEIAGEIDTSNRSFRDEMETLRLAAYRDTVTGLPNRLSFMATLKKGLALADQDKPCSVFHLMLEGFKGSGDVLGITGGQRLQVEIASRFSLYLAAISTDPRSKMRDMFLAAIGPGQFGLFMPAGNGRKEATALARELRQLFEQPFDIDGRDITMTISGGLAIAPDDGDISELVLKNASLALNEVLRAGQNGFQFFSPRLERLALGRSRFEQELRDAVDAEAFHPVFQPKVDLLTNKITGVEALARWQHTETRMISPATFIPLAEELGLVDDIGFQILRQSCHAAAGWYRDGMELSVAVNVSPRQFERPDFIDQIVEALRTSGLPPALLELEITETMAVSKPERVISVMEPLRAMGIKLAIDDFGTGHANLSLLTQIPFDIFKIDRQFVMKLEEDINAPAIVEMILGMGQTLGLKIVAEGIETEGQAKFLRDRKCDLAQGFLYSPGISDQKLRDLLTDRGQNPGLMRQEA